jgi:hypothetical protein
MGCKIVVENKRVVLGVEQEKLAVRIIGLDVHVATLRSSAMISSDCRSMRIG